MNELISVIIPVFKVEQYLKRCVDSVLGQTYKNLEIILVDDGSPDVCGEICDLYAKLDNRVKVIHKTNGGLSDARNVGLANSQGDYISFIDSDDWIHKKYFEKLYNLLIKSNSDISICSFNKVSNVESLVEISRHEIYEYSNIDALKQLTGKFYLQMIVAWGKLYKKSLFDIIQFPVCRVHEDEFTSYKVIFNAKKIVFTTEQLYYYWQREDSIMGAGFNINARLDKIDALKERAEYFNEIGLEELSSKTYRSLFVMCLLPYEYVNQCTDITYKEEFNKKFKELRRILRKSNQKFSFKLFYELYYIAPKIMYSITKMYMYIRKKEL